MQVQVGMQRLGRNDCCVVDCFQVPCGSWEQDGAHRLSTLGHVDSAWGTSTLGCYDFGALRLGTCSISSMVAAVSQALRELSEPCLSWTREPRGQLKSLGARRQYSQTMANNVLPVMTGSPPFQTGPPPDKRHLGSFFCNLQFLITFRIEMNVSTPTALRILFIEI